MKHEWVFFKRWNFVACQKCGLLRSERNADADNCRGIVRVGPRTVQIDNESK